MMAVFLKVLSILGIILLVLFSFALVLLLTILFYPITYRVFGRKTEEEMFLRIRALWLFGLLRIQYDYPDPGSVRVKLLWKTLFDSAKEQTEGQTEKQTRQKKSQKAAEEESEEAQTCEANPAFEEGRGSQDEEACAEKEAFRENQPESESVGQEDGGLWCRLLEKYQKIRYTFRRIYDKIKHIWHNISCYKEILSDRETVLLLAHAKKRLGKIFTAVRPGRLRAAVLFGTGSPDTTGYAYGVYGMLLPKLGKNVLVTPDFTRAVLEGEIKARGHVTLGTLLWHGGRLALDKRLRLLISRLKAVQPLKNGG